MNIVAGLALVLSLVNTVFLVKVILALVKMVGPKIDDLENRHLDLIKKLKKIL